MARKWLWDLYLKSNNTEQERKPIFLRAEISDFKENIFGNIAYGVAPVFSHYET